MVMKFEQIQSGLKQALNRYSDIVIQHSPERKAEVDKTVHYITEVIDKSFSESELLDHLKLVADDLLREDYYDGCDKKSESSSAIFESMLVTALLHFGKGDEEQEQPQNQSDTIIDFQAHRSQRQVFSEQFAGKLTETLQYYRWGFDAMRIIDRQLARALENPDAQVNMYDYAYHTLQELHPDLDDSKTGRLVEGHIHKVLQSFLEDGFCDPLRIDPDDIPEAKELPLHSLMLICKAYDVAKQHARASKLPEDSDMFDARMMREVKPLLKDLLKNDRYLCADASSTLETIQWLDHSFDMAATQSRTR